MNSLKFLRGSVCYVQVGTEPKDRLFFRVMTRKANIIRLKALHAVERDGKWVPGDINPEGELIWRTVKMTDGAEYGAPYQYGNLSCWIRLFRKPKGGKRKGAGRKSGWGKGRVQKSRSICLSQAEWDQYDAMRGKIRRGDFLRKLMEAWQLKES